MPTALALGLVGLVGFGILHGATDGFRALTSETARRLAVVAEARPVPDVPLEDQSGRVFSLAALAGRTVVVNFIYTHCPDVCLALGSAMQQLQRSLPEAGRDGAVTLLSISFDPEHDDVQRLAAYARWFGAGPAWRMARPRSRADLDALLQAFGVVVIPDGRGGFVHNAALHLVDRRGHLVHITDLTDVDGVRARLAAEG